MVNIPYCLTLAVVVQIGSVIGITQVNRIVKMTGRPSIIVILLAAILFLSFFLLPIKYVLYWNATH